MRNVTDQHRKNASEARYERYVPAAGRAGLTRFYDGAMRLTMREARWRPGVAADVLGDIAAGGTVLDVGCGTGTQAIELARLRPDAHIVGVDGDPEALDLARAKPGAEHVRWVRGLADQIPLGDASADRIILSLLLHHLELPAKRQVLAECRRVLRPGGRLHVVDWGRPRAPLAAAGFMALRMLDGWSTTREHAAGQLADVIRDAGFADVRRVQTLPTVFGTLERLVARTGGLAR